MSGYLSVSDRFDKATRQKFIVLPDLVKSGANAQTLSTILPKTGLLARLHLKIRGSVAGTITSPNALGFASMLSRVRLYANSGIDLFSVSGAGYHYLLRTVGQLENDTSPQSNARAAVTATNVNLDMTIPLCLNQRDPLGLIMLQSEQTILTLAIDLPADSAVATGISPAASLTITPIMEIFTVPADQQDWPNLGIVHQILEDTVPVAGAGTVTYNWPRQNRYLQVLHGLGIGVAGSDLWSVASLRVNQSDYIFSLDPGSLDLYRAYTGLTQRVAGTIPIDMMGSAGLGMYDKTRDSIDSSRLTDLATVITATGAGTLFTIRRQLVALGGS